MPKPIVIDARFYGINHTGIGRYVENLIKNLPEKVTLIVNLENANNPDLIDFPKIISRTHPYSIISQFEIPWLLFRSKCKLLHVPYSSIPVFWTGKLVTTFHDLIKHESMGVETSTQKPLFYWLKYFFYLVVDYLAIKKSDAIIVPTEFWKQKISQKYNPSKIYVTYEAVSEEFKTTKPKKVPNLKKPFIVHTGNLYPHKNIQIVFQALKKINYNLYLICARSVFAQRAALSIQKMGLDQRVFFLGKLTDAETKFVYSQAEALVFPSKIEGFGLNGLEAMACGLPVISSKNSCLPEVYGQAALYFDPESPDSLVHQLNLLPKHRDRLIKLGYHQIKKYSWFKMAQQTWQIYQNALQ